MGGTRVRKALLLATIIVTAGCDSRSLKSDADAAGSGGAGSGGDLVVVPGTGGMTMGSGGGVPAPGTGGMAPGGSGGSGGGTGGTETGAAGAGGMGTGGQTGSGGRGSGGMGTGGHVGTGGGSGGRGSGTGGTFSNVCTLDGTDRYPYGSSFPGTGDNWCNHCRCNGGLYATCTAIGCSAWPGGPGSCTIDTTYRYGDIGGHVAYHDEASLLFWPTTEMAIGYRYARRSVSAGAPEMSCSPAPPACNTADRVDPADVLRAVADPDVQAALAQPAPPLYGRDTRPVDGAVFQLLRADGRGFLAGSSCQTSEPACAAIPAGVSRMVTLLRALDTQQLMDPSCAALAL
jgi:hypothetical protein